MGTRPPQPCNIVLSKAKQGQNRAKQSGEAKQSKAQQIIRTSEHACNRSNEERQRRIQRDMVRQMKGSGSNVAAFAAFQLTTEHLSQPQSTARPTTTSQKPRPASPSYPYKAPKGALVGRPGCFEVLPPGVN
ncbi:hypothetical protein CSOJ01_08038 [Colletotrichum sojae]|uniref:Uncharacterized protein n=1 Tax=Colletotrichum sojae TaxID=2175907 RepID=A0A8H6J6Y4_9PEZI|nr:hypothetical protein CSOJ01_08038 [Colletotrichum sojae]